MALKITEDWVRERVELNYDKLDDVRSLSLPGTYHEKITELGTALEGFSRLKHLDLSRNALHSLEGLTLLRMLEKLNLYYNNIATLKELFRLRSNQHLQELDLRLNPVAKNEPDYRLFLVHMLPNLRRLDDRPVRDTERKAALLHFSSEQAVDFAEQTPSADVTAGRPTHPRAGYVKGLYSTALHNDDNEVLDLMVRTDWQPGQPVGITGSCAKAADSQEYTRQDKHLMSQQTPDEGDDYLLSSTYPTSLDVHPMPQPAILQSQGQPSQPSTAGQIPSSPPKSILNTPGSCLSRDPGTCQPRDRGRVKFADEMVRSAADPNLKFKDELEAYTKFTSHGLFTPAPDCTQIEEHLTVPVGHQPTRRSATESRDQPYSQLQPSSKMYSQSQPALQNCNRSKPMVQAHSQSQPLLEPSSEHLPQSDQEMAGETAACDDVIRSEFMDQLLTVVDKYWNGSGSLHKHQKFQGLAKNMMADFVSKCTSKYQNEFHSLNEEMAAFAEENIKLRGRLSSNGEDKLRSKVEEEQKNVEALRGSLQQALEEGELLKKRLFTMETSASSQSQKADDCRRIGEQNNQLTQELSSLKLQLVNYKKMQELTSMLQESHKSLVTTNEHLLKELEETRQRHQHEVEQLHWSYDQLKRSSELGSSATSYGQHNGIL
ncbi:centrosomal protein of 72 kDa-like isoform X1 [Branchiostoma lanceolatum]|uniref:centrosomal protein of 72 kDa-like isoform X1 n=1 Tax=Branchiostoma lanceolatum TaxID=7740 RepID=UPI0034570F2A